MGLIRGEIQQNEGLFVIFLVVKNEFLLSRFVICVTIFTSYNKGDERKRNETRFDTITVSLKAIWLVLGSVFLSLTSAAHLCRTRVFFAYVWKILAFSRYNLTASKLLSFSRLFFGNNFYSNAFCGHRQLFGRFSRPASCSSLNSHLFVFLPVFCFECCYFCVIHARERKKRNHILRNTA